MDLSAAERDEVIALIKEGKPLPARYRSTLFEDAAATELIWPGKTSEVERTVLPFQSIEQIDEPRTETVTQPDLFTMDAGSGRQAGGWTNKLIWGDNKLILSSLVNGPMRQEIEDAGGLKLVYIDPPFDVGADFSIDVEIGDSDVTKSPSVLEEIAYRDTWGRGRDSYVAMMYERIKLMHELLAEDGSLYVHLDSRVGSHVKLILDEVFGAQSFQRQIIWRIGWVSGYKSAAKNWIRNHDLILYYVKNPDSFTFNKEYLPYPEGYVRRDGKAPTGRGYPIEDVWNASPLEHSLEGDLSLDSIQIKSFSTEKTGYATQKSESIVRRIVEASSNPGDLVADFFCGSGTLLAVAEKSGRKWIGADLGRFAVHTSRKRMVEVQRGLQGAGSGYRAFEILNLGSYERQYFAGVDMSLPVEARHADSARRREQFLELVLGAYGGVRVDSAPPFHGIRDSAAVFVGPLDAPVTQADVRLVIDRCLEMGLARADVLGFEFEMGIKPTMADEARELGVQLSLRYIPNDVFDKRAVAKGQVQFYDVGYVEVKLKVTKRQVTVSLTDFGVFYAQDDADAAAAGLKSGGSRVVIDNGQVVRVAKDKKGVMSREVLTKSWADWIDYWAVDFDFESQRELIRVVEDEVAKQVWTGRYIFENQWQSFRTRRDRDLELTSAVHSYDKPGTYKVAVKVIDVFGNDTTKVIPVKVS